MHFRSWLHSNTDARAGATALASGNLPLVCLYDFLDHGKAKPAPFRCAKVSLEPLVAHEFLFKSLAVKARPRVVHFDAMAFALPAKSDKDSALARVFDGIGNQIGSNTHQRIRGDLAVRRGKHEPQLEAFGIRFGGKHVCNSAQHFMQAGL